MQHGKFSNSSLQSRLPIKLGRDDDFRYYQGIKTTALIKTALEDEPWDCLLPLDCDEFLLVNDREAFEVEIASLAPEETGLLVSEQYAPVDSDDYEEPDPVCRIVHRTATEPPLPLFYGKAIAPYPLGSAPDVVMGEGNHHISVANRRMPERWLVSARIAHFPVRSVEQFVSKVVTTRLTWLSRHDYRSSLGRHIAIFYDQLRDRSELTPRDLLDAAFMYLDAYLGPHHPSYQRKLIRDPVQRRGGPLYYLDLAKISALPRIIELAEQMARQLGQADLPFRPTEPGAES